MLLRFDDDRLTHVGSGKVDWREPMRVLLFVDLIDNAEQIIDHYFNPELLPYLTLRRGRSGLEKIDLPTR